ncbi:MAG: hypothetical protein KBC11_00815 [Candidatus Pacebacteria bacterium]|nr:hypothetical protein [Candidatus Paceibacterota bacterium]
MKILIIHGGQLDENLKSGLINKLNNGEGLRIRTSKIDFLKEFFEDFPKNSEKIKLVIFDSISDTKIKEVLEIFKKNEAPYLLRVGLPPEDSSIVDENILCINSWNPEKFFIHLI